MDSTNTQIKVAVIGAGFGGLAAGIALKREHINDFLIFEEAHDLGGVWRENTYPGCNCDVPAHLYSLTAQPYHGDVRYPGGADTLDYLHQVAHDQGLDPHLRFNTAIASASFDEDHGGWTLVTATGQIIRAEIVICATGMLHRRYLPDIPGRDDFTGPWFHSAQWDHRQDLTGRRVAVIGTGASAVQLIPELAATAAQVQVYQRTPTWVLPKPRARFGRATRWLLQRIPLAHTVYRAAVYYAADLVLAPIMTGGWSARPAEFAARAHLFWQVRDRQLRAALTPTHPIGAKRILLSSNYCRAFGRDNVELITTPIRSVTATGIRTTDDIIHDADVIVYATGFTATQFLAPMVVSGRGGQLLHQHWADGGGTFLGVAVRGFPDWFILAGPNTFNSAGSSIDMKERQLHYITAAIRLREQSGAAALEVSEQATRRYTMWLHAALARTVWPTAGCPSWYKDTAGRITAPWPSTARAYARMTRRDPALDLVPVRVGGQVRRPPRHECRLPHPQASNTSAGTPTTATSSPESRTHP
ncbi:NAD(P)/FAD-dependent oxidoreductase [Nocardia amamiensis]|uniref:NAD(P)/FAD-dependent oxidoreductase n=1 Tax=Nocardia amamiensis TaxID=404578 RepID=A0ABS0D378_9NOCA|nr:NAD(P)/FAD-dependent oxidoreductase [Nocardia amamiensis]MBF6302462.1 NAD(P)/FAD-dependent oxidoreductase [Nocardia amamiensis]